MCSDSETSEVNGKVDCCQYDHESVYPFMITINMQSSESNEGLSQC
jgi:hypothetical protein